MLRLSKLGRMAVVAMGVATFSAYGLAPTPAAAWWNHGGWHGGWGWHHGWGYWHHCCWGPRVVVGVPPPVVYGSPAPVARVWVPGHWYAGYWVRGHWRYW